MGIALAVATRLAAAQAPTLRLEDAVHLALTRNERAKIAELQVEVSQAGVDKARAAFLPILTVGSTDTLHPDRPEMSTTPLNVIAATGSLSQPILNLPALPLYRQAGQLLSAQQAQSADDQRILAFDAARAFLGVLTDEAVLEAATRQLDSARANLADTQARAQAQLTSSNDVTRAQVDLASAAREVAAARGTLENARVGLALVLNAPVAGALASPDATLRAAEQKIASIDALVDLGLKHRPDLLAARHAAAAAHEAAVEPLYRIAPTLGLSAQVTTTSNPPPNGQWHDETATLALGWTLFDAGVRYADRRSRLASAQIADLDAAELARTVESQVRGAVALLESAQAALTQAEAARQAARQSADETAILYRQGLAKAIELVDANDQRFVAEVDYSQAEFQMAQAYLNLRQALGLDPLGTELK